MNFNRPTYSIMVLLAIGFLYVTSIFLETDGAMARFPRQYVENQDEMEPVATEKDGDTVHDRALGVQRNPRAGRIRSDFALRDMPIGGISMYAGLENELPENWKLCNGQLIEDQNSPFFGQNVPDLRGLFVKGAGVGESVLETGGKDAPGHYHLANLDSNTSDSPEGNTSKVSYTSRFLLCLDSEKDGICDSTSLSFSTGHKLLTRNSVSALSVNSKPGTAAGHQHAVESHLHSVEGLVSTNTVAPDNRPRHMRLHFIIRIK